MVWTDKSTGKSYSESGNDPAAYAKAAARIQGILDAGREVDKSGRDILEKAAYIGVYTPDK